LTQILCIQEDNAGLYNLIKMGFKLHNIVQAIEDIGDPLEIDFKILRECINMQNADEKDLIVKLLLRLESLNKVISMEQNWSDDGISIITKIVCKESKRKCFYDLFTKGFKMEKILEVLQEIGNPLQIDVKLFGECIKMQIDYEKDLIIQLLLGLNEPDKIMSMEQNWSDDGISIITKILCKDSKREDFYDLFRKGFKMEKILEVLQEIGNPLQIDVKLLGECIEMQNDYEKDLVVPIILGLDPLNETNLDKHNWSDDGISIINKILCKEGLYDNRRLLKQKKISEVLNDKDIGVPTDIKLFGDCIHMQNDDQNDSILKLLLRLKRIDEIFSMEKDEVSDDGNSIISEESSKKIDIKCDYETLGKCFNLDTFLHVLQQINKDNSMEIKIKSLKYKEEKNDAPNNLYISISLKMNDVNLKNLEFKGSYESVAKLAAGAHDLSSIFKIIFKMINEERTLENILTFINIYVESIQQQDIRFNENRLKVFDDILMSYELKADDNFNITDSFCLFKESIMSDYPEVSFIFFTQTNDLIGNALVASAVLKHRLITCNTTVISKRMKCLKKFYDEIAIENLKIWQETDKSKASRFLLAPNPEFNDNCLLRIAMKTENIEFLSHEFCENLNDMIWKKQERNKFQ
ncbi:unnamed protein product, partial [Lymnaea stagnalis]